MRRSLSWLCMGLLALCPATLRADGTAKDPFAGSCETHGTRVHFFKTPSEAAKQARKDEKLVLVLHISGIFEDASLT